MKADLLALFRSAQRDHRRSIALLAIARRRGDPAAIEAARTRHGETFYGLAWRAIGLARAAERQRRKEGRR